MSIFPITFWCAPPLKFTNDERYREIAEAGFTLVSPPYEEPADNLPGFNKEENLRILDLCQKYGLKATIHDKRMNAVLNGEPGWLALLDDMVADYKNHPALHSYYVVDEPGAGLFQRLGDIIRHLEKADPDHPGYINLFPNYATPKQLQSVDYRQHIEDFMQIVKPSILSYDHYHFLKENLTIVEDGFADEKERLIYEAAVRTEDRPGFFENIEIVRDASLKYNTPFMVVILLLAHGSYRDLTEAEIRWEVYQTLAYGSSCISYFTYWCPKFDPIWQPHSSIIENDGRKSVHYDEVKRINSEVAILGSRLLGLKSKAVFHIGQERENVTPFSPYGKVMDISGGRLTAGFFEQDYILLANKDYINEINVTLELGDGAGLTQISKADGTEKILSAENNLYRLKLAPGDGELLKLHQI